MAQNYSIESVVIVPSSNACAILQSDGLGCFVESQKRDTRDIFLFSLKGHHMATTPVSFCWKWILQGRRNVCQ
jgi:hypothetical protein